MYKMVQAGKTGCAWCVVWDELVDYIFEEVGKVYPDCLGPQMLSYTTTFTSFLCFSSISPSS